MEYLASAGWFILQFYISAVVGVWAVMATALVGFNTWSHKQNMALSLVCGLVTFFYFLLR